jgi:hypothetical protein
MKKLPIATLCAASLFFAGCGGDDTPESEKVSEEVIQADLEQNFDESSVPSLEEIMKEEAPPATAAAPTPGAPAAAPVGQLDNTDGEGNMSKTPLQLMQEAVDFYHSPAERGIDSLVDKAMENMEFQTEQAYEAARAKIEQKYQIKPMQSLDDLVKARILGKIPEAPGGKQWKYDPTTKTVALE